MANVHALTTFLEGTKILLIDLETLPALGWFWDRPWETRIIEVEKEWQILSFSAKWLGEDKQCTFINHRTDKILIEKIWKLLDEADIVIAHNGDRFDIRKINARILYWGLGPPSPYKTIDTKKVASRKFGMLSNKQDDIGEFLGTGRKLKTDKDLWFDCMRGDKEALQKMKDYNAQDVILLERNYLKLRPWISNHFPVITDKLGCPRCGSVNLQKRGLQRNATTAYHRIFCNDCRGWSRTVYNLKLEKPLTAI